jgi:uncharacterized membrane protein YraQ (UPF0718 family)
MTDNLVTQTEALVDKTFASLRTPEAPARRPALFRKPKRKEIFYLALVVLFYVAGVGYVYYRDLSFEALFYYGLLQPQGVTGEAARLTEIETPLSWNLLQVTWFILIKGAAVLVELFQYWIVGMLIAGALVVFVSWEKVKQKMGYGGVRANLLATTSGAIIPICSCGIVPVLAGMVEAGIPLGPTMAFLIAAPMLNIPTVFMTAGVLGWKMAIGRIIATFGIALGVGQIVSYWQRRHRGLKHFLKINVAPKLSPKLQKFAFEIGMKLIKSPNGVSTAEIGVDKEANLLQLEEMGLIDRNQLGRWQLVVADAQAPQNACFVLPTGDVQRTFSEKLRETVRTAYDFFLQLNYYLVLAVIIAGAIKVLIPTSVIVNFVGGESLNSVLVASAVAVMAYVCTYVEVPTALALMAKGMGGGATLSYLLGGPGLSLPSIAMLSGVFKPRVLGLYVGLSFVGCVIAGYLFNLF